MAKEGAAGASQAVPEEEQDEDEEEVTARVLDKLMEIAIRYPMVRACLEAPRFISLRTERWPLTSTHKTPHFTG